MGDRVQRGTEANAFLIVEEKRHANFPPKRPHFSQDPTRRPCRAGAWFWAGISTPMTGTRWTAKGASITVRVSEKDDVHLMPAVSRNPACEGCPQATPVLLAFKPMDKRSNHFRWKVALVPSPHNEVCQILGK